MTTALEACYTLSSMAVGMVKAQYSHPPTSLNAADLPALWVQMPTLESNRPIIFAESSGWPRLTLDVIVAVAPVGASTQSNNHEHLLATIDNLDAALAALDIGKARPDWSISAGAVTVAGVDYWAVKAEVNIYG